MWTRRDLGEVCSHLVTTLQNRDRGKSVMKGGGIFVYSDSVSLISFEIDCYTVCESEYMKMLSPPQLPTFSGPCKTCCSCPHSNRFFSCISVISLCSLLEVNNYNLSATGYFQNRLLRLRSDFNGKQP